MFYSDPRNQFAVNVDDEENRLREEQDKRLIEAWQRLLDEPLTGKDEEREED